MPNNKKHLTESDNLHNTPSQKRQNIQTLMTIYLKTKHIQKSKQLNPKQKSQMQYNINIVNTKWNGQNTKPIKKK